MNKNYFFLLGIILFLLSFVSSLRIDLSPAYLNLDGNVSEKICGNFSITSDRDGTILILDKWANEKSKNIKDYNLGREIFGIQKDFPDKIFVSANQKENMEICFVGKKTGDFYGAVLFESENGFASVGTWINLNITEKEKNFVSITGSVINKIGNKSLVLGGIIFMIIEGVILLFLIKYVNNKKTIIFIN